MQPKTLLLAIIAAAATSIQASPLAADVEARQGPLPAADCCGCSVASGGFVCTVPHPDGCYTNPVACPFDPETQEQCCCCDPGTPAMRCQAITKGDGCFCPAVECPFQWSPDFLPIPI